MREMLWNIAAMASVLLSEERGDVRKVARGASRIRMTVRYVHALDGVTELKAPKC